MGNRKREFVIKDLTAPDFVVCEGREVLLTETEESGKSRLQVQLMSEENLCIANIDKKKTEFHFFQEGKAKSLYERVEFGHSDTMPAARHGRSGIPQVRMGEEWGGDRFGLNFGERISFAHVPVKMERDREGILTGFLEL